MPFVTLKGNCIATTLSFVASFFEPMIPNASSRHPPPGWSNESGLSRNVILAGVESWEAN